MVLKLQQQDHRLQELGDFLRTRRARLTPEEVGLPKGTRRKTPGLRRAEVAQLVGVSVDWYTWLEQGRPITPSTQVLERLVQTLRLDAHERTHLFLLAQQQPPPALVLEPEIVSPALQHFLDQFDTRPAFVSGRRWDILACNAAGCAVFGDFRRRTTRERNTIWGIFTNPLARQVIVDWEEDARQLLAQFRSMCGRYPGDAQLTELIHDLMLASPEFRAWWPDHEVRSGQEGRKTLNHPQVGYLLFERLTFQVFDTPDLKVTVYTPLEEADTPRKVVQLLEQWYQQEGQGPHPPQAVHHLLQQQRRHDLLYTVVRGTRIHTKEGKRLSSIVSCTWSGSRCATMGLHRSRETHKNTRSSRSTCARLLSDIEYKWGQMVVNAHLSPLVDHLLKGFTA